MLLLHEILARIETTRPRYHFSLYLLILHIRAWDFLFRERESRRIKNFGSPQLQQILLRRQQLITPQPIIIRILVLPQTKSLRHDTGAFRHRIVIDRNMHRIYEIGEARCILRCHELPLLKQEHLLIHLLQQQFELVLITRLTCVKLKDSLLEGYDQGFEKGVVFGLLGAGGETTIDTHKIIIEYKDNIIYGSRAIIGRWLLFLCGIFVRFRPFRSLILRIIRGVGLCGWLRRVTEVGGSGMLFKAFVFIIG